MTVVVWVACPGGVCQERRNSITYPKSTPPQSKLPARYIILIILDEINSRSYKFSRLISPKKYLIVYIIDFYSAYSGEFVQGFRSMSSSTERSDAG